MWKRYELCVCENKANLSSLACSVRVRGSTETPPGIATSRRCCAKQSQFPGAGNGGNHCSERGLREKNADYGSRKTKPNSKRSFKFQVGSLKWAPPHFQLHTSQETLYGVTTSWRHCAEQSQTWERWDTWAKGEGQIPGEAHERQITFWEPLPGGSVRSAWQGSRSTKRRSGTRWS